MSVQLMAVTFDHQNKHTLHWALTSRKPRSVTST